jgi:hypothetical protein
MAALEQEQAEMEKASPVTAPVAKPKPKAAAADKSANPVATEPEKKKPGKKPIQLVVKEKDA